MTVHFVIKFLFELEELLGEDAAVAAILVVFAVDDPGSLHEAEKILKQLAAKHFLDTQVMPLSCFRYWNCNQQC
jgi:hypothetical protein